MYANDFRDGGLHNNYWFVVQNVQHGLNARSSVYQAVLIRSVVCFLNDDDAE